MTVRSRYARRRFWQSVVVAVVSATIGAAFLASASGGVWVAAGIVWLTATVFLGYSAVVWWRVARVVSQPTADPYAMPDWRRLTSGDGWNLSLPDDPDLEVDVDGVVIVSVVRVDPEMWVRAEGGFGWWIDDEGPAVFLPGDPDSGVEELSFRMGFVDPPPDLFDAYYGQLCDWRDRAVPLRFCHADGRIGTLIENETRWLPVPLGHPPATTNVVG